MPGTVTLLFTDVVGSTELLAQLGDEEMQAVLQRLSVLQRDEVTAHHGEVVRSSGNCLIAAFSRASDAVDCAISIQRAVARLQRRGAAAPGVCIGISSGETVGEGGDYHGTPAVEAAGLWAAARGGQILVTEVVRLLAVARGGLEFTSLGPITLQGLRDPVAASEIVWEQPAGTSAILPLPAQLSTRGQFSFAGREVERAALAAQWQAAVAIHAGSEVKWLGDGLMSVFTSPADAVRCAVAMQQAARRRVAGERLAKRILPAPSDPILTRPAATRGARGSD